MSLAPACLTWVGSVLQLPGRDPQQLPSPQHQVQWKAQCSSSISQIKALGLRSVGPDEPDIGSIPELIDMAGIMESTVGLRLGDGFHPQDGRWSLLL